MKKERKKSITPRDNNLSTEMNEEHISEEDSKEAIDNKSREGIQQKGQKRKNSRTRKRRNSRKSNVSRQLEKKRLAPCSS